jgi:predicted nuclease with TOPRIM domain
MEGIREMIRTREDDLQPKRERYDYIVKILEKSTHTVRRLVDELADFDGETVKAAIKEKIKQLETEQNMLAEEKIRLAAELAEVEIPRDIEKKIAEIASKVNERLPNATFDGMRELLELLDVKVTFYNIDNGIKLHVTCMLPDSDDDIMFSSS